MQRVTPACKPTVKQRGRRRRGGDESEEESAPAKRQQKIQTVPRKSGVAHDGGQQFEVKMAAVIGLRGMARGDNFQLSTNKPGCGNFDDLVYTTGTGQYYLQLKYTDNPDTTNLVHSDLVPLLHQCFESYCQIIQNTPTSKNTPIHRSEFIIYTNKQLGPKLSQHSRQQRATDVIFKTCDTGEVFNFTPDKNKQTDVYTLVENSVKKTEEFRDLNSRDQDCKLNMINEFLKKLIMVTGQKGQEELDAIIVEEIRKHDVVKVGPEVYERELLYFKTPLDTWWRNKKEIMSSEMVRSWLQNAKTESCLSVVRSLFNSTKNLVITNICFSADEIARLRKELSNKPAVHLRPDALPLCSNLLLDCLPQSKCIFVSFECLQSHRDELLHAWLGGVWEWFIVSCDAKVGECHISETCLKISEIIKQASLNKYVIILSECSVQHVGDFVPIYHKFSFEQLSKESQEMVLGQKMDFQGCEVTMRSVLQGHGNVEDVLVPELVTDLVTEGTAVNIGGKLQENKGYYAPRVLERDIYLRLGILKDTDLRHDVFAVSGMRDEDLSEFVPAGEAVAKFTYSYKHGVHVDRPDESDVDKEARFFRLESNNLEACYLMLCERHSEKTLHWFEFKKGNLLWIRSCGAIDTLLRYVDDGKTRLDKRVIIEYIKNINGGINEESIWDSGERTVLVAAEPGMGKTSTTTQVARHTKERDPTSWVLRINWNDHTRKLTTINAATFNFETLVEFLCSAAFPESKYTDINRSLLKQALQSSGNVTVLMDGFDEISPTHADKAAVILSELMKTNVRRLWVTSRPVEKERLQMELSVIAYGMKNLSRTSQEDMLITIWKPKTGEEEIKNIKLLGFIEDLLRDLNNLFYEDNFTGCPLYISMIATVYETDVENLLKSEVWFWPEIDLVNLYERFVERKLHIYLTEKLKVDITISSVVDILELLKQTYLTDFETCALAAILPPPMLESLHNKKAEEEIQSFLDKVQAGKDKTGVVMNVVEGKPQFVHRTFAEYFTARWFSKNFQTNRSVLEHILFDPNYRFVRDMFDRILAKDCPLHCAVLEWHKEHVRSILEAGCDVSAVDKGGRTVMHLSAARMLTDGYFGIDMADITYLLCHYDVPMNTTDRVMQWTPLQYAMKAGGCCTADGSLESSVQRCGLDMIRQRAHDPDYIGPVIMDAVMAGHLLLLEFIHNIGVNIHQASSSDFLSPLHAAIEEEALPVVRWLIQHGADCNTRYSDRQTPLFYAVTESSVDVVRALVEEGGASLDERDDYGRTAIDWAKVYTSNSTNPDTSVSRRQLEQMKEIVKYLRERGCKESSAVRQNNDS